MMFSGNNKRCANCTLKLRVSIPQHFEDDLDSEIDNLYTTDDGEPSEEAHSAPNC